jgi:hypothetical protein
MSALRLNYQEAKPIEKTVGRLKEKNRKAAENSRQKTLVEEIRKDYQRHRIQVIDQTLENLSEMDRQAFMERFHSYAQVAISTVLHLQRKKYTPQTVLSSPQIKAILRQFAEQELIQPQELSLDDYIETLTEDKRAAWIAGCEEV